MWLVCLLIWSGNGCSYMCRVCCWIECRPIGWVVGLFVGWIVGIWVGLIDGFKLALIVGIYAGWLVGNLYGVTYLYLSSIKNNYLIHSHLYSICPLQIQYYSRYISFHSNCKLNIYEFGLIYLSVSSIGFCPTILLQYAVENAIFGPWGAECSDKLHPTHFIKPLPLSMIIVQMMKYVCVHLLLAIQLF